MEGGYSAAQVVADQFYIALFSALEQTGILPCKVIVLISHCFVGLPSTKQGDSPHFSLLCRFAFCKTR